MMSFETVELSVAELQTKLGGKAALNSHLIRFVKDGDLPGLRLVLAAGANPNAQNDLGITPATLAALYGHTDALKILHKAGADLNPQNVDGYTPWYVANSNNQTGAVDFLRQAMASRYPVLAPDDAQKIAVNSADLAAVLGNSQSGAPYTKSAKQGPGPQFG